MNNEWITYLQVLRGAYTEKGGPGSGNWGHAGRKGKRGGSAPGKGKRGGSARRGGAGVARYRQDPNVSISKISKDQLWEEDPGFEHIGSTEGADIYIAKDAEGYITAGADIDIAKDVEGAGTSWDEAYIHYIESLEPGGGSQIIAGLFERVDVVSADAVTQEGADFFTRRGFEQVISPEDSGYGYGGWAAVSPKLSPQRQKAVLAGVREATT